AGTHAHGGPAFATVPRFLQAAARPAPVGARPAGRTSDEHRWWHSRETGCNAIVVSWRSPSWGRGFRRGDRMHHTVNTPPTRTPSDLPGLHPRLTVLQAAPEERAALAEVLTELCAGDDDAEAA